MPLISDTERMRSTAGVNGERFRTDHLVLNLGRFAVSGGVVTFLAQVAKFVLQLTSAAVLARLLSPKDFGLLSMVLAVTGLLGLFKDLGLSAATVQRESITQQQVSTLFWINVTLGGVVGVLSLALAPSLAWFYRDSRLTGIMWAVSVTFPLTGSTVQHQALLVRQMRFGAIAVIEVASILAGILTACCLAMFGFAYWSLVGQQLCAALTGLVLTWWTSGWRPTMPQRHGGVAPLLRFGAHLTLSDLVGRVAAASDSILIGRVFGAEPLGLYSRAAVLLARPLEQVVTPINAVLMPVLSRLQSDPARYRRTFIRAHDALALITLPFAALCLVLAEPIVLLLLGPQWKEAVPLFAAFTLVAVSLPLSLTPSWLFTSQGRGRDLLNAYVVAGAVTVGAYVIGLYWGPRGVILSLAVVSLAVRMPILYHLAGRRGPVCSGDLWKGFLSHLPCWGAAYLAGTLVHDAITPAAPFVQLLVCFPFGMAAGVGTALALKRPRESALYAWGLITGLLAKQWSRAT